VDFYQQKWSANSHLAKQARILSTIEETV